MLSNLNSLDLLLHTLLRAKLWCVLYSSNVLQSTSRAEQRCTYEMSSASELAHIKWPWPVGLSRTRSLCCTGSLHLQGRYTTVLWSTYLPSFLQGSRVTGRVEVE